MTFPPAAHAEAPAVDRELLTRLANTVRGLSMDAVQHANSGHPGLPLGCADMAVTLWYHFLRFDAKDPHWPNRDRFVLSAGHGSMLLYSLLHLAGYGVSLDDLKGFRQFGSITPGHPEIHLTPGVEATTGPLGQGFANAVGMALSGMMLRARFDDAAPGAFDHFVYVLASDGDLMEGVVAEAASLAGEWQLGNLVVLYDDNDISLDGPTSLSFSREDRAQRFEAYGWHVQHADGFDQQEVANAITEAQRDPRPSIIICKTVIGFGSPNKAGSSKSHGSPLGADEVCMTKERLGISPEPFHVPEEDRTAWSHITDRRGEEAALWRSLWKGVLDGDGAAAGRWNALSTTSLAPHGVVKLPLFDAKKKIATRVAGQKALEALAPSAPWLVGGSADLSSSTKAIIPDTTIIRAGDYSGRDIYFGVREHAMGSIINGLSTQGSFRAFGATFLTFSDYNRPAIRLAALSHIPSIFVFTHDSIFLGEDGPTHQAVEHVASLRLIPNLLVLRPGDAAETAKAWEVIMEQKNRPAALVLTRQDLATFDRTSGEFGSAGDVRRGAYILRREKGAAPALILIATGSEVEIAVDAARILESDGVAVRVVSMPSFELFREQPQAYRDAVLPAAVTARIAVEAGVTACWHEWVGPAGAIIGVDRYGASAPAEVLAVEYGFTAANIVEKARAILA